MEAWPIVFGTVIGGVTGVVVVVGLKYLITSLENRKMCCSVDEID